MDINSIEALFSNDDENIQNRLFSIPKVLPEGISSTDLSKLDSSVLAGIVIGIYDNQDKDFVMKAMAQWAMRRLDFTTDKLKKYNAVKGKILGHPPLLLLFISGWKCIGKVWRCLLLAMFSHILGSTSCVCLIHLLHFASICISSTLFSIINLIPERLCVVCKNQPNGLPFVDQISALLHVFQDLVLFVPEQSDNNTSELAC
jgi:hypothetical protein